MKSFSAPQLVAMLSHKPKTFHERRLHTLLLVLLDTGMRINEAITLSRDNIDLENLLITVTGKGNKQRMIPFSLELRKVLFGFLRCHEFPTVFPNRHGGRLCYNNLRRDFIKFADKLGIEGFDGSFHAFRRCFARNFVQNGGNVFYLQRLLGHTTLKMSREYVDLETKDLQKEHNRTSILSQAR
jgi:integrase/recombinase XerD